MKYKDKLAAIDRRAEVEMISFVQSIGGYGDHVNECLDYAFALATKYGEAAGAAACELYEAVAAASGITLEAMPAATATYEEVAKSLNGIHKISNDPAKLSQGVSRLVKRTAADTTLQNAVRDGAYFAWVPSGDTCAFCLMLASNGWRKAGKKTLKGDHAEHIHANCDCQYAVTFDPLSGVEGYDPAEYEAIFDGIDGDWNKKINVVRQRQYAANPEKYRAQHKAAYAKNNGGFRQNPFIRGKDVTKQYIQDATPNQGNITYEPGFNYEKRKDEANTAKIIHKELGGNIIVKEERHGQKNPDYEWLGALWDLKTTSTSKSANSAIKSGMGQIKANPGGIFLNFGGNEISMEELIRVIEKRMYWYPDDCADIVIISKGKVVKVLRY